MLTVVTTYRDNFDLIELMFKYYKSYWNSNQFIFCIGLDKLPLSTILDKLRLLDPTISNLSQSNNGLLWYKGELIEAAFYHHTPFNNAQEWNNKRNQLIRQVKPHVINKHTALIDNDEFIYCPNPNEALSQNNIKLHYCEYVPNEDFSFDMDWRFTNQSYYYRAKIKGQDKIEHNWCASWSPSLYRKNGHVGKGNSCQKISYDDDWSVLNNKNIVFHFGTLSRQFHKERKYWSQSTENNTINKLMKEKELDSIFEEHHLNCTYPSYICNWLKSFLISE